MALRTALHGLAQSRTKHYTRTRWTRFPYGTLRHQNAQNHSTKWHQKRHRIFCVSALELQPGAADFRSAAYKVRTPRPTILTGNPIFQTAVATASTIGQNCASVSTEDFRNPCAPLRRSAEAHGEALGHGADRAGYGTPHRAATHSRRANAEVSARAVAAARPLTKRRTLERLLFVVGPQKGLAT